MLNGSGRHRSSSSLPSPITMLYGSSLEQRRKISIEQCPHSKPSKPIQKDIMTNDTEDCWDQHRSNIPILCPPGNMKKFDWSVLSHCYSHVSNLKGIICCLQHLLILQAKLRICLFPLVIHHHACENVHNVSNQARTNSGHIQYIKEKSIYFLLSQKRH